MKNLLLLLLLANILYLTWGMVAPDSLEPGVVVVNESDLGPPLAVAMDREAEAAASVGAVLGSGDWARANPRFWRPSLAARA